MKINGTDISAFNAEVSSKLIQRLETEIIKDRIKNNFLFLREEDRFKSIEIKVLFRNDTREKVYKDISNFLVLFKTDVDIKFNNISNHFRLYLTEHITEETEFEDWLYLNLTLEGYEYSDEESKNINLTQTGTINNVGNVETPCVIEITPTVNILDGMTIKGFTENPFTINDIPKDKKLIINGETGKITLLGENAFNKVNLWEMPRLKSGNNQIEFSKSTCNIKVTWKPRYF